MMQAGIIGLGVMGRVLALALHNAGWQVTLLIKVQALLIAVCPPQDY